MPFVSPMIFWIGLGTVSVPIIIHLLNRRRFRIREWAAMQFLLDSLRRNRRRLRIEELILMALRCLLLFLLGMAIARFTGCGDDDQDAKLGANRAPETTVFVLEDSFSMAQRTNGSTLLDDAVKDITSHLERLSTNAKSDRIAILLTSRPGVEEAFQDTIVVPGPEEMKQLVARLKKIEYSDSPARLGEALVSAGKMLTKVDKPRNLFVYGDFREVDLGRQVTGRHQEVFKSLQAQEVRLVALDYGRKADSNLTIERIELLDKRAIVGFPARIGVTVRNNSSTGKTKVPVSLSLRWPAEQGEESGPDDADKKTEKPNEPITLPIEQIASIAVDSTVRVEFVVKFPKTGPAIVTAQLPLDDLPSDNAGYLAVDVRTSLQVLIVDGRPDLADPTLSESFRLERLLDPEEDSRHGAKVKVVTTQGLSAESLSKYDLVLLLDVPKLPSILGPDGKAAYPMLAALERYVRDGGGLGIFTGDNIDLAFYNGPMYAESLGLSPLVIRPPQGDFANMQKYRRIDAASVAGDGFLSTLRGEGGAIRCAMVRFYGYTPADSLTASSSPGEIKPPRIVARFTDPGRGEGPPAIVVRQFGKGSTMMLYSTASTRWNDWADDQPESAYTAPMNDMMMYLARSQAGVYTDLVGQPIVHTLDREFRDARVTVRTPRYPVDDIVTLEPVVEGEGVRARRMVRYKNPPHAGCYKVFLTMPTGSPACMFFARNTDPIEGDLTPGGSKAIARAFGSTEFKYVSRRARESDAEVKTEEEKNYWVLLLAGVLTLLAIETFLAQIFGHHRVR